MFIIPVPHGLQEIRNGSELLHLTLFVTAEDYYYTGEDAVLFTAQAEGEHLRRQSNCKQELVLLFIFVSIYCELVN